MPGSNAETDTDLIWAAIAGLRADIAGVVGRLERLSAGSGPDSGKAEEVAEAWRAARQAEVDRLLDARAKQGKGEEIDAEDQEALDRAWMEA